VPFGFRAASPRSRVATARFSSPRRSLGADYIESYIRNYAEDYTILAEVNMAKRTNAPVIKPQPKVRFEQINFKIDTETLGKLRGYAEFINSEQSYIIR